MNSEEYLELFEVSQHLFTKGLQFEIYMDRIKSDWIVPRYGDGVIDHFREKSLFFRDTANNKKHDAKKRLSISGPSLEKPVAEIIPLKENRP